MRFLGNIAVMRFIATDCVVWSVCACVSVGQVHEPYEKQLN